MSEKAADIIIKQIKNKPNSVVGFATGKTPLKLYSILAKSKLDFSIVKTFNLDEYYPIKREDRNSFYYFMHKNLFNKINIKETNTHILNGKAKNPKKECENYEKMIKKKPIDLQILGLGVNGHIAFNEPGAEKTSKTRLVELSQETIKINKLPKISATGNFSLFKSATASCGVLNPDLKINKTKSTKALTMGIATLMAAKKIILLASGKNKAEAIKHLIEGKKDKNWPVSFLKGHKNLIVIIDEDAARLLQG